jgi:hypothetical protein
MLESYHAYSMHTYSLGFFLSIFVGYRIQSALLQYYFYVLKVKDTEGGDKKNGGDKNDGHDNRSASNWKIQHTVGSLSGIFWGDPLFSSKPNRAPFHRYVTGFNLFMASTFACLTSELAIRGSCFSKLRFVMPHIYICDVTELHSIENLAQYINASLVGLVKGSCCAYNTEMTMFLLRVLGELIGIVLWQSVVEYYWHLMMHHSFFYTRFHKWHHFYKAPEPWDDLYIHPLEAFGYYCILYSPAVLFPVHVLSFLAYMVIMGLAGVADHSGIILTVHPLYNSVDHDNHHKHFNVNYGFPFPFMDILMNTYYAHK